MPESESKKALYIVESLRAGIASHKVSAHFSHGREEILECVDMDLADIAEDGNPRGVVISASYGQGKTHLLKQLSAFAHKQGFAVASLVVSKETPVHNLKNLYQKIATSVVLPGEQEPGLERQLARLSPASQTVQDLLYFTNEKLHPKLHYVLKGYFLSSDPYDQFLLYGDLTGHLLPLNQIKEILRRVAGTAPAIPRLANEQFGQYFLLLSLLIRQLRCKGLVILFDEAELLGALGLVSRIKAYLHMASLLGLGGPFQTRFFYSVFFVASGFYSDVIVGKRELERVKYKATERFGEQDARAVSSVLDFLLTERKELQDLTRTQVRDLMFEIQRLHGLAYRWEAKLNVDQVLKKTEGTPLRTVIRGAVESLDLGLLYGSDTGIAVSGLEMAIPEEDEELFESEYSAESELVE